MKFSERLRKAAAYAQVEWGQSAIAKSLGIERRQTVDRWMGDGTPSPEMVFHIADTWNVDARWLATGKGDMIAGKSADGALKPDEEDMVARYRGADPRWKLSLRLLSYVATEDQLEVAGDVNVILARAFGKHPTQIRYVSNQRVQESFGDAPHVAKKKEPLLQRRATGTSLSGDKKRKTSTG